MTSGGVEPREDVVLRAKAALKYAPELPWEVGSDYDPMTGANTYYLENIERFRGLRNNVYCGTDVHLAEFIAASRQLVPELIAEVERLRDTVDAARERCTEIIADYVDDGEPVVAAHILEALEGQP